MDDSRFDAVARAFGRPASRRRTLVAIVATALIPAVAAAKPEPAKCLAQGRRCSLPAGQGARHGHDKGKHKGKGKHHPPSCNKCCSRFGSAGSDGKPRCSCKSEGEPCGGGAECCGGLCRAGICTKCPGDLTACNGACVDLQTADNHCGECATACADGQRCVSGSCVCDAKSCPRGCCGGTDGTACLRGTSDQACGVGGATCQECDLCHACDGTQCVNATACCGANSVCQGGTCATCDDGQRCQRGQCVCDATNCPDGCCDGNDCNGGANNTACGKQGAACFDCTQTSQVCHKQACCTPDCDGKCGGADDGCGGLCPGDAGSCPECQTCSDDGQTCQNVTDGEPCGGDGSGLRCCVGTCPPPPPPCVANGTCCDASETCDTDCCADCCTGHHNTFPPDFICGWTDGNICANNVPGQPCATDRDCGLKFAQVICRCGTCCSLAGSICNPGDCCSGQCAFDGSNHVCQ